MNVPHASSTVPVSFFMSSIVFPIVAATCDIAVSNSAPALTLDAPIPATAAPVAVKAPAAIFILVPIAFPAVPRALVALEAAVIAAVKLLSTLPAIFIAN